MWPGRASEPFEPLDLSVRYKGVALRRLGTQSWPKE